MVQACVWSKMASIGDDAPLWINGGRKAHPSFGCHKRQNKRMSEMRCLAEQMRSQGSLRIGAFSPLPEPFAPFNPLRNLWQMQDSFWSILQPQAPPPFRLQKLPRANHRLDPRQGVWFCVKKLLKICILYDKMPSVQWKTSVSELQWGIQRKCKGHHYGVCILIKVWRYGLALLFDDASS